MRGSVDRLIEELWRPGEDGQIPSVSALLDGARDPKIYDMVSGWKVDSYCLFLGDLHPALARAAPYLIQLGPRSRVTRELLEMGWGKSWGVFVQSQEILQDLRRHFRRFLKVKDPDGRELFFRYYDPRVLRVYLSTCNRQELEFVFGPVSRIYCEGEDPSYFIEYARTQGKLVTRRLVVSSGVKRGAG